MIAPVSLENFEDLAASGDLDNDLLKVLHLIEQHGPITSNGLEPLMGKPKHCFSGRITKLQELQLVHSIGRVRVDGSSMNQWVRTIGGK